MTKKEIRIRIRNLQIQRAEQISSIVTCNQDQDLVQMQVNIEHQNRHYDNEVTKLLTQLNTDPNPKPFTENWRENLNSTFIQSPEGAYRDHASVVKIGEAVRDMLKTTGQALTMNEILDIIDPKRHHGISAHHLGGVLRDDIPNGILWQSIPKTKHGDCYRYSYVDGKTRYVDREGNHWEA